MTMSVQIATGGESGAVYPFILKGAGTSGEEVSLSDKVCSLTHPSR